MRIDLQETAHAAIDRAFDAWDTARCRLARLSPIIVMTRKQRSEAQLNAFKLGQDAVRHSRYYWGPEVASGKPQRRLELV